MIPSRREALFALAMAVAALANCSKPVNKASTDLKAFDVEEAPAAPEQIAAEPAGGAAASTIPAAGPQIAYTYQVQYQFDRRNVAEVQARQIALCERLAPRCIVQKSNLTDGGPDDSIVTNMASVLIDTRLASAFNGRLDAIARAAGAKVFNRQTTAEDVTKQVIDTDARIRAKQALADRLLRIIRTSNGKVGELVEAERSYAAVEEELDAAREQQAELRRRVQMSEVAITYAFNTYDSAMEPIRHSLRAIGTTLSASVAALLTFLVAATPWALVLGLYLWLRRRFGWRWPFRRKATDPADR